MLVEYGHRLGLRCHVSEKERRRAYLGRTVADLMSEDELRAYVPLVATGDAQTLETDRLHLVPARQGDVPVRSRMDGDGHRRPAAPRAAHPEQRHDRPLPSRCRPSGSSSLRLKLDRSPLLRRALDDQNWHILKSDHLRRLHGREEAHLDQLAPLLGLDPEIEREAEQLPLFG